MSSSASFVKTERERDAEIREQKQEKWFDWELWARTTSRIRRRDSIWRLYYTPPCSFTRNTVSIIYCASGSKFMPEPVTFRHPFAYRKFSDFGFLFSSRKSQTSPVETPGKCRFPLQTGSSMFPVRVESLRSGTWLFFVIKILLRVQAIIHKKETSNRFGFSDV